MKAGCAPASDRPCRPLQRRNKPVWFKWLFDLRKLITGDGDLAYFISRNSASVGFSKSLRNNGASFPNRFLILN